MNEAVKQTLYKGLNYKCSDQLFNLMQLKSIRLLLLCLFMILSFNPLITNISLENSTVSRNASFVLQDAYEDSSSMDFSGIKSLNFFRFLSLDFIAPVITDVNHIPLDPTELDIIAIGANVTDESGIYNVTLHYCINGGIWVSIEMIVSFAFPEIFIVDIGPFAAGDLIQYYVTAYDASGNWNEGVNDNGGLFYSLTVLPTILEINRNPILMIVSLLGIISLVYLAKK